MRSVRVIGAAVAALMLLAGSVGARPSVVDSVWPIQMQGQNICTASSVSPRLWLTAAHCVDMEGGAIMGEPITVVMRDVENDLAFVTTPRASAPALKLAKAAPPVPVPGDDVKDEASRVYVIGYPFGFPFQVATVGFVAALEGVISEGFPTPMMLVNVTGAPGNSGSAILNAKGEVISVLQVGWGRSFSPMVGGVRFSALDGYRGYFEGKLPEPTLPGNPLEELLLKILRGQVR